MVWTWLKRNVEYNLGPQLHHIYLVENPTNVGASMSKKGKEPSHQCVYLDTDHIQDFLWGKPDEIRAANQIFQKLRNSIKNPDIKVRIPFVVVGELINNLVRDKKDNLISKDDMDSILHKFLTLQNELNADLTPPGKCVYFAACELIKKDDRVAGSDALIVCQALCDPYSSHLLTTDTDILYSTAIQELEKDMRKQGKRKLTLRIASEF